MLEIGVKAPDFALPDQNGMIEKVFAKVKAAENPGKMLEELQ